MNKYEKLYELAKEDFSAEVDRLSRIEAKATTLLSVLTILIGLHGVLAEWTIGRIVPPQSLFQWMLVILTGLVVVGLVATWIFVFRVLTVDHRPAIAVNSSIIKFYHDNRLVDVYYGMSRRISEKAEENRCLARAKARRLTNGYISLMVTGVLILVLLVAGGAYKWNSVSGEGQVQTQEIGGTNEPK